MTIRAKGRRPDGQEFSGDFRNMRFFRKENNSWVLYAWRNDPEGAKNEKVFTGTVMVQLLSEQGLPDGKRWQQVFFHPGARTGWHIHPEGQDLVVIGGDALVVKRLVNGDDLVFLVKAGNQIRIEPGEMHWHGTTSNAFMVHIAYNGFIHSTETSCWFDTVSETKYTDANKKAIS